MWKRSLVACAALAASISVALFYWVGQDRFTKSAFDRAEREAEAQAADAALVVEPREGARRPIAADTRLGESAAPAQPTQRPSLRGTVRDDQGAPLTSFRIRSEPLDEPPGISLVGVEFDKAFHSADGSFELRRLWNGEWRSIASAAGYADSGSVPLTVPGSGERLEFVLARVGSLFGFVRTPRGAPLENATVEMWDANAFLSDAKRTASAADGSFSFKEVWPTRVYLTASAPGFAPPELRSIEVEPGQHSADIELLLRKGATITGEVSSVGSELARSSTIRLSNWEESFSKKVLSDAAGRFVAEHLPAGKFRIEAHASAEEVRKLIGEDVALSTSLVQAADVEVVDMGTLHVVLALQELAPVELTGRITLAGASYVDVLLWASATGAWDIELSAETDADGVYSLTLPRPGTYEIRLDDWSGVQHVFVCEVPLGVRHVFDLTLEAGSISGTVRGPRFEPLASIQVIATSSVRDGARTRAVAETEENGRYTLANLPPGAYSLSATQADGDWGIDAVEPEFADALLEAVLVTSNARAHAVDFVLEPGGGIEGLVRREAGSPAAHCLVKVSHPDGRRVRLATADNEGRFKIIGLPLGPYVVDATSEDEGLAARELARVEVLAGTLQAVSLEMVESASAPTRSKR